jgi:L-xylulokinase|tara:strand:- start:430 stop:1926 length:1497 start_codon:yes stop_codon:yes gene_type:complete
MKRCYIGVDVGLTSAKVSAYDVAGVHLSTFARPNPRTADEANHQDVDMVALWETVRSSLSELTAFLDAAGFTPHGIGVTGSGNGAYLVTEDLKPARWGIASTDTRAEGLVEELNPVAVESLRLKTGSRPWAAQTPVLLKWLAENEPRTLEKTRWLFSCKDWITSRLTGTPSADVSDWSSAGLLNLTTGEYEPDVFSALGLDAQLWEKLPPLYRPDELVGVVSAGAAEETGLLKGTAVVAGSIDVVAAPIGAGSANEGDVTIIAGTWGINSVAHRLAGEPPDVTLNAVFTEPGLVFAQEDAPTSMANMEWFAQIIRGYGQEKMDARKLVEDLASSTAGANGLLFIPFIYGAPQYRGASAALLGQKGHHRAADVSRALAEGVTQYHRVQLQQLGHQGIALSSEPWTLAGGGARNPVWAQIFANILGHPVKRHLEQELGSRGVAALAFSGTGGDLKRWKLAESRAAITEPDEDRAIYEDQVEFFDQALQALQPLWSARVAK